MYKKEYNEKEKSNPITIPEIILILVRLITFIGFISKFKGYCFDAVYFNSAQI